MEEKGASVLVAVIILLGMTIALVGTLALILTKFQPGERLEVELKIQRGVDRFGRDELVLIHEGGERVRNAFRLENGFVTWLDLEVRVGGVRIYVSVITFENKPSVTVSGAELDGKGDVGKVDFMASNSLRLPLGRGVLDTGDWVEVIYSPWGQILLQTEI